MIFTALESAVFFVVLVLAGWALYPSAYARGLMHKAEGDRSRAVRYFNDYLESRPYHKGATFALVSAYEAAGTPEQAIEPLLRFYRHRKGDLESGEKVLALLQRVGSLEQATAFRWELFEDVRALPAPPRKRLEELMVQAFQEAAARQDDKASLKALAYLAELTGEGGGHQSEMLRLLLQRRQLGTALKLLTDAIRKDPRNIELRRTVLRIHLMRGDIPSALGELRGALSIEPESLILLGDRVAIFLQAKRWGEAEADLHQLIRLEPDEAYWPHELARCYFEQKRDEEAFRAFEAQVERKPGDRERWFTLIYALADRKHNDRAIEKLLAFLKRFPADVEAPELLVHLYQATGRIEEAVEALRRQLAKSPADADKRDQLVSLLIELERLPEAAAEYETLIKLRPLEKELWLSLAYVQQTRGLEDEAAKVLERYLKRFPGDARAIEHLASLYLDRGDRALAIELLRSSFGPGASTRLKVLGAPKEGVPR